MSFPHPLFILASPYSYTSIVCAMLGQHPQAYGTPEINLLVTESIQELVDDMTSFRPTWMHDGLLRTIAQLYTGEQTLESISLARRWIHMRHTWSSAEMYYELCRKVAPLQVIDKSPVYSNPRRPDILPRLKKVFPNAYYIHLLRHPLTQGQSWLKLPTGAPGLLSLRSLDYSTHPPTLDPQFAWYEKQRLIMDFLSDIPESQQMRLRGEDILNDPHHYLELMCQWLNFSWDESIYNLMLQTEGSSYACAGPYGAMWGNNSGFQKSPRFHYRPVKASSLKVTLPWRSDNQGFTPEVIQLAEAFGYE